MAKAKIDPSLWADRHRVPGAPVAEGEVGALTAPVDHSAVRRVPRATSEGLPAGGDGRPVDSGSKGRLRLAARGPG
jgi:hypothetical protein